MSQWQTLLKLTGQFTENLMGLYSEEILPIEVRQDLAPWIESQDWKLAARDQSVALVNFQNLLEHLDKQYYDYSQLQKLLEAHNVWKFKYNIQSQFQQQPQKLAEHIRDILQQEKQIIVESQEMESKNGQPAPVKMETEHQYVIEQRVIQVKERIQSVDQEVKSLEEQQEIFDFRYKTYQKECSANLPAEYIKARAQLLQSQVNELDRKRRDILSQIKELLGLCETLYGFLQKELGEWLHQQKLQCIGANTNTCLKSLEGWVTKTVEVFFHLRHLLRHLTEISTQISYPGDPLKSDLPTLECRLKEMLTSLLKISFVVDKQPSMLFPCKRALVIRTSTQFSVRARLLVNLNELKHNMKVACNIDKNPPNVSVRFRKFNLCGTLEKSLEDVQREGLVVEYKHLILKEQRSRTGGQGSRGANDGSLSVTEELHNFTFTTPFEYEGFSMTLEAVTLPFVVISNINQFTAAWASVLWFNLLSQDQQDLTFFLNPPAAPWSLLANALSWQFSCCTKRGLNMDQLQMLQKKLCGAEPEAVNSVTWNKFSKETMPNVSFTFWVWFDAIVALVKGHLENIWNDGHLMGFVSRSTEDSLLKTMKQGTFLLRFSESIGDGGITCSWVDHQGDESYSIHSVEPYTKKELSHIPLTEIIRNYQLLVQENIPENPLKYLYPSIPKDEAFEKYYEQKNELTLEYQRYMKRKLIIVSQRNIDDSQSSLASATPQYCSETSGTPNYEPAESPSNWVDDMDQIFNGLEMQNILIDQNNDPVLPSVVEEISEVSQELFNIP